MFLFSLVYYLRLAHSQFDRRVHTITEPKNEEEDGCCVSENFVSIIAKLLNATGHNVDPEKVPQNNNCVH